MAIAVWQDDYCTGHEVIDQQHRRLFSLVNEIYDLTQLPTPPMAVIKTRLTEFADCAVEHFELEEGLMAEHEYPNLQVHCGTHKALVNKVTALLAKFDQVAYTATAEVTPVLADWMVHHIRGEDQQMIRFFQRQNVAGVERLVLAVEP
ncbi:MAG: bacteriohemerythrin [Cyanobacteria bacterium J06607_6]